MFFQSRNNVIIYPKDRLVTSLSTRMTYLSQNSYHIWYLGWLGVGSLILHMPVTTIYRGVGKSPLQEVRGKINHHPCGDFRQTGNQKAVLFIYYPFKVFLSITSTIELLKRVDQINVQERLSSKLLN